MCVWRLCIILFLSGFGIVMVLTAHASRVEMQRVNAAQARLQQAIKNPEYMLDHWIELPVANPTKRHKILKLGLRDAVLLALRYNPNIQNAELDRIIQRYQLRLAQNAFELQYALAGTAMLTNAHYSGVGNASTKSYLASPEFNWKSPFGTEAELKVDNTVAVSGNYNPLLSFSLRQPLLRGFGRAANEVALWDAVDREAFNKLSLQQSVIDQITQVIILYRTLILSVHNLQIQQLQLSEARKAYKINQNNIKSGQLEPSANIQQAYQIESLSLMVEQAEQNYQTTAQDLLQAIGLNPDLRLAIEGNVALRGFEIPDAHVSMMLALNHNLQYLALKMVMRADERAYQAAKNQQLWQLDLKGNVLGGTVTNVDNTNNNRRGTYSGNNVTESASVVLTIPLNDLNRRNALISAKVKLEKDRLSVLAAKRALLTTIKNIIISMHSLRKCYELAARQVDLARKSYELEKKKQEVGIASALDVNNTQNQWIQAQKGLISAKIAYLNQLSTLQRIQGTALDDWQIKLRYMG